MEIVSVIGLSYSQSLEVTEHVAINKVDGKSMGGFYIQLYFYRSNPIHSRQ